MSLGGGGGGAGHTALSDAAEYLYDVLLVLQQRGTACNLVIAVNKMDLFTALPPSLVSKELEGEITRLRRTRSAALLDSSVGQSGDADDAQSHWLGVSGRAPFTFSQLAEAGVHVDVLAASVVGAEGPGLGPLWDWIARLM